MNGKIKIGIIGTGFAHLTQIPGFLECPDAEVVSVASAKIENAERTALEFGIGHYTDDWTETVRREDIDLICITTPPNLHHQMALFSLEHGKHVLCEKPMAMNSHEAAEMTASANEKGLMAIIDHELRFLNGRRIAYRMIRDGKIGQIIHCKQMFRNASRGTTDVPWNWWSDINAGGGALGAIGSHAIDAYHWFLDTEISDVFCQLKTNIKERLDQNGVSRHVTADDEVNMILKFADSKLTKEASGAASFSVVESGNYDFNVKIFGTKGAIMIGEGGEIWFSKMGDGYWTQIEVELGDAPKNTRVGGWSRGFLNFARQITSALKEGNSTVSGAATFDDGLKIQRVLDASRESNARGTVVKLEPLSAVREAG